MSQPTYNQLLEALESLYYMCDTDGSNHQERELKRIAKLIREARIEQS